MVAMCDFWVDTIHVGACETTECNKPPPMLSALTWQTRLDFNEKQVKLFNGSSQSHAQHNVAIENTCACKERIAKSVAASLSLTALKGLIVAITASVVTIVPKPKSSSRTMNKRERPSSCDNNSCSESKRTIREWRLLQSTCSSHLQYISTSGSNYVHVPRIAWCEGRGSPG